MFIIISKIEKILSYKEDTNPGDHVTIQLEDTQQVLKVNKKFIEKVSNNNNNLTVLLNTVIKVWVITVVILHIIILTIALLFTNNWISIQFLQKE